MQIVTAVSPRFEICAALADVVSPRPLLGRSWFDDAGRSHFFDAAQQLGLAFWVSLPDILGADPPEPDLDALFAALEAIPDDQFGKLLDESIVQEPSLTGNVGPRGRSVRQEWRQYLGLGWTRAPEPWRDRPQIKSQALAILGQFRSHAFQGAWDALAPRFEQSRLETERLAQGKSLSDLVSTLRLRAHVDEQHASVRALRGGCEVPLSDATRVYLLPSVFNRRRFWGAASDARRSAIFFPYVDAAIAAPGWAPGAKVHDEEADPYLVCKAIADPLRLAILKVLATEGETSAAQLTKLLGVSKANISHHLFQLREAKLLNERPVGKAIGLSLRMDPIGELSGALASLIGGGAPTHEIED